MAEECKCEEGLPGWLATFADLMSLLMCFFVLLLSFAEVDAVRFKKMAEALKDAFGVQREIPAMEIVKGVSVIKQEFSPTIGEPSLLDQIKQQTTETEKEFLEMQDAPPKEGEGSPESLDDQQIIDEAAARLKKELEEQARQLQDALQDEIQNGIVTVESDGKKIVIRIQEKGSFPSGTATLDAGFYDVMDRISAVLSDKPGRIVVAGHTDNVPIRTSRFRSNWELSSARAVTVLHALLDNPQIDPNRVVVEGFADTRPLVPNDSAPNRAKNRRVELILVRGDEDRFGELLQLIEPDA